MDTLLRLTSSNPLSALQKGERGDHKPGCGPDAGHTLPFVEKAHILDELIQRGYQWII